MSTRSTITRALFVCLAVIAVAGCAPVVSGDSQGGLIVGVYNKGVPSNAGQVTQVAKAACAKYGKISKLTPANGSDGVTISYTCVAARS